MVTTTAAVTSTMQIVEYHVTYNTTTDQTHLQQTTVLVGVRVNLKKGYHRSNKYYLKAYSAGSVRPRSWQTPSLCYQRQTHAVSLLEKAGFTVVKYVQWDCPEG
jgi:hypothetical protein